MVADLDQVELRLPGLPPALPHPELLPASSACLLVACRSAPPRHTGGGRLDLPAHVPPGPGRGHGTGLRHLPQRRQGKAADPLRQTDRCHLPLLPWPLTLLLRLVGGWLPVARAPRSPAPRAHAALAHLLRCRHTHHHHPPLPLSLTPWCLPPASCPVGARRHGVLLLLLGAVRSATSASSSHPPSSSVSHHPPLTPQQLRPSHLSFGESPRRVCLLPGIQPPSVAILSSTGNLYMYVAPPPPSPLLPPSLPPPSRWLAAVAVWCLLLWCMQDGAE